ncbi:MAG: tRNA lysidine(34) synthetase TilS [Crocinitomicaceae bacterium]|nr:tRNA lysidine(34) synthetase TilS [Crocinitomicaceae bacterium]MDP5067205.1 tRNA lysidine(34) synthetase TilS [Crocinitomicaceae bacterium]
MASANLSSLAAELDELRSYFKTHKAGCYLVATSGGKDSMLLCELMRMLALPFEVLHVNYGLRGAESEADQAIVEAYCQKYKLPLHIKRVQLAAVLQENHKNLQAEARRIRYAFFSEMQQQQPGSLICTAHHAEDQIETFWLQLARGAGMKGLAAMEVSQKGLLRPLLNFRRKTLDALATELGLQWREDSSNASLKYRRNRWRHVFIPFLKNELPQLQQSILLIQKQFALEIQAQEALLHSALSGLKNNRSICLNELTQLSTYQFIELFKLFDIPTHVIRRLPDLFVAESGKFIAWQVETGAAKSFVVRQKDQLIFLNSEATDWTFALEDLPSQAASEVPNTNFLIDRQRIKGTLFFRQVEAGDRMPVRGMKGTKKVLQILKEAGIPAPLRKLQCVLCDEQQIIAVPNLQVSALVQANENTTQLAALYFSKKP